MSHYNDLRLNKSIYRLRSRYSDINFNMFVVSCQRFRTFATSRSMTRPSEMTLGCDLEMTSRRSHHLLTRYIISWSSNLISRAVTPPTRSLSSAVKTPSFISCHHRRAGARPNSCAGGNDSIPPYLPDVPFVLIGSRLWLSFCLTRAECLFCDGILLVQRWPSIRPASVHFFLFARRLLTGMCGEARNRCDF